MDQAPSAAAAGELGRSAAGAGAVSYGAVVLQCRRDGERGGNRLRFCWRRK
jgi:hypothetical protein